MKKVSKFIIFIYIILPFACSDNGIEWKGPLMPLVEGSKYTFSVTQKGFPICQVTYKITKIEDKFIFGYYSATGIVNNMLLMVSVYQKGDDFSLDGHFCSKNSPEYKDGELLGYKIYSDSKSEQIVYFKLGTGVYRIEFYEFNEKNSQMELVATNKLISYSQN